LWYHPVTSVPPIDAITEPRSPRAYVRVLLRNASVLAPVCARSGSGILESRNVVSKTVRPCGLHCAAESAKILGHGFQYGRGSLQATQSLDEVSSGDLRLVTFSRGWTPNQVPLPKAFSHRDDA
jgi:hypothetical protein